MSTADRYTPEQIAATRQWVENWKRVGPLLEKIRHEELRALTDDDVVRAFESLSGLLADLPPRPPRASSGFIEQQRLFQKLRSQ
ncbi:MAG TPA: hypothetical protein VFE46_05300 [Pirellulales bacterium]|jgi:hypothetical protein|nr:hypothetical protein [Pirellulales bacterium]